MRLKYVAKAKMYCVTYFDEVERGYGDSKKRVQKQKWFNSKKEAKDFIDRK